MVSKESFKKNITKNIKNERLARKLTIEELAVLLGVTPGFMGLIERGKRGATAYNLYKLADIFNTDMQSLIRENIDFEHASKNMRDIKLQKLVSLSSQLDEKRIDFLFVIIKNINILIDNE